MNTQKLIEYLKKYKASNKIIFILAASAIFSSILTYFEISNKSEVLGPNPSNVIGLVLIDLIIFLLLTIFLARKFFKNLFNKNEEQNTSKLQNRIIIAFSLVAAVPTIIVSIFSAYFFNYGIQSWFDQKISTVLDQSVIVAESYMAEKKMNLQHTALSIADDLSEMYYDLIHDPQLFNKILNAQAEMRSLDEAIVFQRTTNRILAQTYLSFSLSFVTIPMHIIEKATKGGAVQINSDQTKIRILIKLREYEDTYLLVGRLIDKKIIDHVDKSKGAAQEYYRLKKHISNLQIKFSVVFIFVALLLLLAAISWGAIFASQIVHPIRKLVHATDKAKNGDLTVQVPELENNDEIALLSNAFNRMIRQISHQQKDLFIAQRALAWSDVARRVAHEIKNPLTPIQLSAERLLRKYSHEVSDKEAFIRQVQIIIRYINDIKKIVSEFVNFARLPSPIFTNCNLVTIIKDNVESRRLINDKIIYNLNFSSPDIKFIADITQINQIMTNLLKNSEEAFEICKYQPIISIDVLNDEEFISIIVSDNGLGFPLDLIDIASEAYITTRSKGTGLGLAIVKKIVQDHFGTLEIANNINGGAVIKLIFNLKELKSKLK